MPLAAQHADALRLEVDSAEVDHMHAVGAIPGVIVTAAADRNGPGTGRLRSTGDGSLLSYRAPGSSSFGSPTPCPVDGDYLLEDGEDLGKWLRVEVSAAYLCACPTEAEICLADVYGNAIAHDDVIAAEAAAGSVETYTITMVNDGDLILSQIKVWLDAATDDLEISDDGASWVSPTTEATALEFPDLAPGSEDTLHLRRTIAAASEADPAVLNHLHIGFSGL